MQILEKIIPHKDKEDIHVGEAYAVWTQTMARYDTLELTRYMVELIHDSDLKLLVNTGIDNIIKPQIKKLEDYAASYKIALPPQPPTNINNVGGNDLARDQTIFKIIMDGAQSALAVHVKAIGIATNDKLRSMFVSFLKDDLDNYEIMIKYGKFKGWIGNPPNFES